MIGIELINDAGLFKFEQYDNQTSVMRVLINGYDHGIIEKHSYLYYWYVLHYAQFKRYVIDCNDWTDALKWIADNADKWDL